MPVWTHAPLVIWCLLELVISYGLMDCPSTEGRNASYPILYPLPFAWVETDLPPFDGYAKSTVEHVYFGVNMVYDTLLKTLGIA